MLEVPGGVIPNTGDFQPVEGSREDPSKHHNSTARKILRSARKAAPLRVTSHLMRRRRHIQTAPCPALGEAW